MSMRSPMRPVRSQLALRAKFAFARKDYDHAARVDLSNAEAAAGQEGTGPQSVIASLTMALIIR
jgi:hypothetical protein